MCYEYPPIGGGGAKVVYGLSQSLIKQGHQVDIVTMRYKDLPLFEELENLRIFRIKCLRLKKSICTWPEMVSYIFLALPRIIKLLRQNSYDINHTHFIYPDGILAYLVKKIFRKPYIITAHGSDIPGYNPDRFTLMHKFIKPLGKIIMNNSQRVIVPSETLEKLIKKISPKIGSIIIPNGINLNKFSANGNRQRKILVVSRLFERKGIQYLLQALTGLKHDFEVNIVGDGPYLANLKKLSCERNLHVNFLGYIENNSKELQNLYETSMIFVFTSEAENFPVVLLEAMIAGLAIITTNDTGCAEVVGESAVLVGSKNSLAIRESLEKLIENPQLCAELGRAARKRVEEYFGWDSISGKHISLYSQLTCFAPKLQMLVPLLTVLLM
ncbi:MAG: glycosyltransferase family 4 protein [Ignavibacteria bacterium]